MMRNLKSIHVDGHEASVKGQCDQRIAAACPQSPDDLKVKRRGDIQHDKIRVLAHGRGSGLVCSDRDIEVVWHRLWLYKSFRTVLVSFSGKDFIQALVVMGVDDYKYGVMMRICKAFQQVVFDVGTASRPSVLAANDAFYDEREKHLLVLPIAPAETKRVGSIGFFRILANHFIMYSARSVLPAAKTLYTMFMMGESSAPVVSIVIGIFEATKPSKML